MNDFLRLSAHQMATDFRSLPHRAREFLTDERRAAQAGTIGELRAVARRRMPHVIFDYLEGAAGDELAARRNLSELSAVELLPRVLVDVSHIETSTSVLGRATSLPLLGAPMGLAGLLNPGGEVALARALTGAGSICVLSAMASYPIEEVAAAAGGPVWFQMYLWRDHGLIQEMLRRARAAGVSVLMVTVDVPCAGNRDRDRRNGFSVPPRVTLRDVADGLAHPRWAWDFVRHSPISWGNLPDDARAGPTALSSHTNSQFDPAATWADLHWLRERWDGHLVIKGILNPQDGRRAVGLGADGIVVSNHGGRQLDGAPPAIRALPQVADAVAGEAEVYFDGGIRRGADIVKALALGARACLAGRALGYGLGAAGEAGARRAMHILHEELRTTLALAGCPSVHALSSSCVSAIEQSRARSVPNSSASDRRGPS
jgi:isopentenyl diphosphate isomerase/L-lactate dehydrogenase-like FMN-dependent dehydrogenase